MKRGGLHVSEREAQAMLARVAAARRSVHGIGPAVQEKGLIVHAEPVLARARGDVEDKRNATERRYGSHLELRRMLGEVLGFQWEHLAFKLAPRCWYRPDYFVQLADGTLEIHEVKGFWRDDALVKIKCAAALNPWFRFRAVRELGGRRRIALPEYVFQEFAAA